MPFVIDLTCLVSTVKNTSGVTKRFGFLPPHGKQLAADEEYTVFGNILEAVNRGVRATSARHREALETALENGDLTIVHTPAPVLEDQTTGDSKVLQLDNGSLAAVDPCWESSASDSDALAAQDAA